LVSIRVTTVKFPVMADAVLKNDHIGKEKGRRWTRRIRWFQENGAGNDNAARRKIGAGQGEEDVEFGFHGEMDGVLSGQPPKGKTALLEVW